MLGIGPARAGACRGDIFARSADWCRLALPRQLPNLAAAGDNDGPPFA